MRFAFQSGAQGGEIHPQLGQVNYRVQNLSWDPDTQVGQTLALMLERAAQDSADPWFKQRAVSLAGAGSEKTKAYNLYQHAWKKNGRIKFQRDEVTGTGIGVVPEEEVIECSIRPLDMAKYVDEGKAVGDCDDFSCYLAALLKSNGISCAFVTVGADERVPDQYSHVYVVAYPVDEYGQKERLPLDASHGEYPGWEVPNQFGKYKEWPVWDRLAWLIGNAVGTAAIALGVFWAGKEIWKVAHQ